MLQDSCGLEAKLIVLAFSALELGVESLIDSYQVKELRIHVDDLRKIEFVSLEFHPDEYF